MLTFLYTVVYDAAVTFFNTMLQDTCQIEYMKENKTKQLPLIVFSKRFAAKLSSRELLFKVVLDG